MKKITLKLLLCMAIMGISVSHAQCLTDPNGQWPTATITAATCDGIATTVATTAGYAGEYSRITVIQGETYTFSSSLPTDLITISSDEGTSAATFGLSPLTWVADVTGEIRFYTHADDLCTDNQDFRTRSYVCGVPPCIMPTATFAKAYDCGSSTFTIDVDITNVGDAASITVTDDQGSASQSVSSPNLVTFGPYPFGTTVNLTVTNDQTPICNITSGPLVTYACPPTNDICEDAIVLNCGDTLTNQVTEGATGGTDASCLGTIGDEIWYSFVGDGQVITVTATATVQFPQIEVYPSTDGTCAGFTVGDCLIAAGTGETVASVSFVSTLGTTYFMHVGNYINGDPAVVFDLAITCAEAATPPANDECDGAYSLTVNSDMACGSTTTGTLSGATGSSVTDTTCFGTADDDVWFSFVATETAHAISLNNVAGSTTDLYHSLWSGDCSGLTLVPNSCSDPENSIDFGLTPGDTYYIRVYSYTNLPLQDTTFDVCVGTLPPPPANDECDGAYVLNVNADASCTEVTAGTIASATPSSVDSDACGGTEDDDIWFSFVASSEIHTISLLNITGGTTDLYHSLWTGDCSGLTLVPNTCSDPNASTVAGLTPGSTYYLRVYSWTATTGQTSTFDVCIGTPPPPPANNDCSGAIEITAGGEFATSPIIGSNLSSTSATGLPAFSCQTNRSNDVWYSVVAPASGTLTIETDTTDGTLMTDSVVSVYRGTCDALTEIGCNDDDGNGNFSKVVLADLTPGETLYIGVWKWGSSADGEFQLSAYDASLANNVFESANFRVYPNPAKNVLNLSLDKTISNVAVFNLLGQQVIAKSLNTNMSQIDMSHLMSGTYFVKVTADNQTKTIKVVKE